MHSKVLFVVSPVVGFCWMDINSFSVVIVWLKVYAVIVINVFFVNCFSAGNLIMWNQLVLWRALALYVAMSANIVSATVYKTNALHFFWIRKVLWGAKQN